MFIFMIYFPTEINFMCEMHWRIQWHIMDEQCYNNGFVRSMETTMSEKSKESVQVLHLIG